MQIFARLSKVNEADRTVEGIIASEAVDRSGEVFDYEKSVPHFKDWSESIAKATDGKNLGNVRAMHGKVAAGVTKTLTFDDAAKQITVKAEIVDDNEWNKVRKGVYTGFSIGGKYGSKWDDPVLKAQRYEAIPSEYSLVDLPCNPEAQFTVVKSDGTEELCKFETTTDALEKWADGLTDEEAATLAEKIARRKDVSPKEGDDKYGAVEFADTTNKKYPIDTAEHIRAAWSYIHMPENSGKYSAEDSAAIKSRIAAAWREKIDPKGPPEAEKMADDDLEKTGRKHTKKTREMRAMVAHHLAEAKKHLDAMGADDPANDPDGDGDNDAGDDTDGDAQKLAKAADDLAKAADDLAKMTSERDALQADLEKIHAEVKRLSELPAPAKGVVTAVEKTIGLPDDAKAPTEIKKADGSIDHEATALSLMKSTYANRRLVSL